MTFLEAKLQSTTCKVGFISGQYNSFQDFTQERCNCNCSVVFTARRIFVIFWYGDQRTISNTLGHVSVMKNSCEKKQTEDQQWRVQSTLNAQQIAVQNPPC